MKRKLNETETTLTKKGISLREKQIKDSTERLKIHIAQQEFIKAKRKYEDIIEPYNRKVEDKNIQTIIEKCQSDIRIAEDDIKELKNQLKNGVESKKAPIGVE